MSSESKYKIIENEHMKKIKKSLLLIRHKMTSLGVDEKW